MHRTSPRRSCLVVRCPPAHAVALVLLMLCAVSTTSCNRFNPANYRKAVESGRTKVPAAAEMEQVFAGFPIQHFIGYSGGDPRKMMWNTEVLLYDRYILTMQTPVEVDAKLSRVERVLAEPRFDIDEVIEVELFPGGGASQRIGQNWNFGIGEWERVVKDGSLEAVGIHLIKDQPVPDFRTSQGEVRAQREPK